MVAAAVGLWVGAKQLMSRASRVQATYSKDNRYFYRLTAKFTVKERSLFGSAPDRRQQDVENRAITDVG
jgi:hypothetical protein